MQRFLKCRSVRHVDIFHPTEQQQNLDSQSIPDRHVLDFGPYSMSEEYREALYEEWPQATVENIIATFLGFNQHFPSFEGWTIMQNRPSDESDGGTTDTETMTSD